MQKPIPLSDIVNSPVNKEREEVSSKTFMEALNGKSNTVREPDTMNVHIEIECIAPNGNSLMVQADINNQNDLAMFHKTYGGYLPRKKWFGLI
jgi:hypothetical protein